MRNLRRNYSRIIVLDLQVRVACQMLCPYLNDTGIPGDESHPVKESHNMLIRNE